MSIVLRHPLDCWRHDTAQHALRSLASFTKPRSTDEGTFINCNKSRQMAGEKTKHINDVLSKMWLGAS
jgi:hypothetical protein